MRCRQNATVGYISSTSRCSNWTRRCAQRGGGLIVRHGRASDEIPALARELGVAAVFANRDYEPAAKQRDAEVAAKLAAAGIAFHDFKDQAIFDGDEVVTQAGRPFSVFTPYKNAWLKRLTAADWVAHPCDGRLAGSGLGGIPGLGEIGFDATDLAELGILPGMSGARRLWNDFRDGRIERYGACATSRRSRAFPTCRCICASGPFPYANWSALAIERKADTWLGELIWRDFYFMILDHFPRVAGHAFKPEYDAIQWEHWPEGYSPRGAQDAPATRWSMPRCVS